VDPGGSIASVWPHPLPPASVPSFADNSTPNSPPLAPHPLFPPICLSPRPPALSVPPPGGRGSGTAFTTPTHLTNTTCAHARTHTHTHTRARGLRGCRRVRGFITEGRTRRRMLPRARRVSVRVRELTYTHARTRAEGPRRVSAEGRPRAG